MNRQNRKIDGALRAFNDLLSARLNAGTEYLVRDELSIANIAAVYTVGWIGLAGETHVLG